MTTAPQRPLHIGILGTEGAGKTTFQTALYFALLRQEGHDADSPIYGNPTRESRPFLDPRVDALIQGHFPPPTHDPTDISYELNARGKHVQVSFKDYRGGALPRIFDRAEHEPLPDDLHELAEYFADCDGYIFLLNARVLVLPEAHADYKRFREEFNVYRAVIRELIARKKKTGRRIDTPFCLVATQMDALPAKDNDPDGHARLEAQLRARRGEMLAQVAAIETFKVSSIGTNFIDEQGRKLPHARLEPSGVLDPIRFLLESRRVLTKRRRARKVALIASSIVVGLALLVGGVLFWLRQEALARYEQRIELEADLDSRTDSDALVETLELIVMQDTADRRRTEAKVLSTLLSEQERQRFSNVKANLVARLDDLAYLDFVETLRSQGDDIAAVKAARDRYFQTQHADGSTNTRNADEVQTEFERVEREYNERVERERREQDDTRWAAAQARNDIDGYQTYLEWAGVNGGVYIQEADRRLQRLRDNQIRANWRDIVSVVNAAPSDYQANLQRIAAFRDTAPTHMRNSLDPVPDTLFASILAEYDQNEWRELENHYQVHIENSAIRGNGGNIDLLAPAVQRYRDYLTKVGIYGTPAYAKTARERIALLDRVRVPRLYKITIVGASIRGHSEEKPDVYVEVYLNDAIVFTNKDNYQEDVAEPVWNFEVTMSWRAYDRVKIRVLDANRGMFSGDDQYLFHAESAGVNALHDVLDGSRVYAPSGGNVRFSVTSTVELSR